MQDEREPDLAGPDNAKIEAKVKKMLEPSAPDEPTADVPTAPEVKPTSAPKPIKITSFHDDEVAQQKEAEAEEEPPVTVVNLDETPTDKSLLLPVDDAVVEAESDTPAPEAATEEATDAVEPATPEEEPPDPLDDPVTAASVDDIIRQESDALLENEDEKRAEVTLDKKTGHEPRFKHALGTLLHSSLLRYGIVLLILALIAGSLSYPTYRYKILNTAGVRSSASLIVFDQSTQQPLKNVQVSLGGQSEKTDASGAVHFSKLKLGSTQLKIEKRAFAPLIRQQVLGWGTNPLGDVKLTPSGIQYTFVVTDFVSGKPLEKVEAVKGESSAFSDASGTIKLTLEDTAEDTLEVLLKADSYREEKLTINADKKDIQPVALVPARKHVFISKRSGKFDVYKVDIDGKNESLVLAGTGSERDDMVVVPHATGDSVALVSTRDNKRNPDGYLLSTLTLINLKDNTTKSIVQSEKIQVVDWIGDRLIYVQIASGVSAESPKRHRLMTYHLENQTNKEIASSNYFNDVLVASGKIYFAPSSAYQTSPNNSLYKVDADGNNQEVVLNTETWNIFRTTYDQLILSAQKDWYDYKIGNSGTVKLSGEPANLLSRVYIDSPDSKHSVWVDSRDGKGVLLLYQTDNKTEKILRAEAGLKHPVRWLTNSLLIYRINTNQETADYVLSIDGGVPKKISDVSNTGGIDKWYYY